MPRFHFHVHDGKDLPDEVGTELPNLAAARSHAVRYAAGLLGEAHNTFWDGADWSMDVSDERGLVLVRLNFMATDAPSVARRSPFACH